MPRTFLRIRNGTAVEQLGNAKSQLLLVDVGQLSSLI